MERGRLFSALILVNFHESPSPFLCLSLYIFLCFPLPLLSIQYFLFLYLFSSLFSSIIPSFSLSIFLSLSFFFLSLYLFLILLRNYGSFRPCLYIFHCIIYTIKTNFFSLWFSRRIFLLIKL